MPVGGDARGREMVVMHHHLHAERRTQPGYPRADAAIADHQHAAIRQFVHTPAGLHHPGAGTDRRIHLQRAARDGQHQHHGVFRDTLVIGAVHHAHQHAAPGAGGDVQRVKPDAEAADHAQLRRCRQERIRDLLQPHHHPVGIMDRCGKLVLHRRAAELVGQHLYFDIAARGQHLHRGGVQSAAQDDLVSGLGHGGVAPFYGVGMLAPSGPGR